MNPPLQPLTGPKPDRDPRVIHLENWNTTLSLDNMRLRKLLTLIKTMPYFDPERLCPRCGFPMRVSPGDLADCANTNCQAQPPVRL